MLILLIYLADVAERVSPIAGAISVISAILWAGLRFIAVMTREENARQHLESEFRNMSKLAGVVFCISILTYGVTPKKETVWMMTAAHVGYQIIDTPEIHKVREIVNQKLENLIHNTTK